MSKATRIILALIRAGRGRALPLVFLALASLALVQIDQTPLASLRNAQFDRYQRQMPRPRLDEPVIVVGIDSNSLHQYGQWPWPRDLMAQLVTTIQASQPLAIGLDIIFAERDRYSPDILAARMPHLNRESLNRLPKPDQLLAEALKGKTPTVLALAGLNNPLPGARLPGKYPAMPALDEKTRAELSHYESALSSLSALEAAAGGVGLINSGPDRLHQENERGIVRRVPALAMVGDHPLFSLPLEMVRQALGEDSSPIVEFDRHGMTAIALGSYRLPTQSNGELLLHYGRANSNYHLSAADVLAGKYSPEFFQSRFVIIGFNTTGLQDRIMTPLGDSLPGIDIHAQVIESLLSGSALQRPFWMEKLELIALLLGGIFLILAVPALKPRYAIFSFAGLGGLIIGAGYLAFFTGQWLFDGPTLALMLSPVFTSLLSNTLITADAQRRDNARQLQASREEAARINGELDAARRIQMGLLPDPQRLFGNEPRFSIAALLEPARAVGGDYYDCFMLDPQHLCLVIGDVSGKGVPASLFMAISKTLTGTLTRQGTSLAEAVRHLETELSRANPEYLFVTSFMAVLDVESGWLDYVSAGHDAPLLVRRGCISRLDTAELGGPPLCALGDYPFESARTRLEADDLLCLFTDGITEADNGSTMFGSQRLEEQLLAASERDLVELAGQLRDSVRAFESGQPAADDLTLMLLRWHGRPLSER